MSLALLLRVRRLRLDRAERAQGRQLLRVRAAAQEHTERQGLRERSEEGELEEFTRHETWPCSS